MNTNIVFGLFDLQPVVFFIKQGIFTIMRGQILI